MEGKPRGAKSTLVLFYSFLLERKAQEQGEDDLCLRYQHLIVLTLPRAPWPLHECAVTAFWLRSPQRGRGPPALTLHGSAPDPGLFYQLLTFCCSSVEIGGRPRRWEDNTSASIMTRFDGIFYSRGCQDELCLVWSVSTM